LALAPALCSADVHVTVAVIITAVLLPMFAFVSTLVSPLPVSVTEGLVVNVTAFDKLCLVAVSVISLGFCITPEAFAWKAPAFDSSITS
jgi:hypothetical protein